MMEKLIVLNLSILCTVGLAAEDNSLPTNEGSAENSSATNNNDSVSSGDEETVTSEEINLESGEGEIPPESDVPVEPEDALETNLLPSRKELVDLNFFLGERWYKKSPFSAYGGQLVIELGPNDLPLRLGPSIRYFSLVPSDNFYSRGTLLEFGLRGSIFWDMENFLPYASVDYIVSSSGSIKGHFREGGFERSGALNLTTTGFNLVIGTSIFWGNYTFVIESSIANTTDVKFSGDITEVQSTNNQTVVTTEKQENIDNDSFRSISVGMGFEL